jgi:hypothetical protein
VYLPVGRRKKRRFTTETQRAQRRKKGTQMNADKKG